MAPQKMTWFRFHVEALADVKLRRMKPEHRWLWVAVLGTARSSPIVGYLMVSETEPCTVEDLADIAAITARSVTAGLEAMEKAGMVSFDEVLGAWHVTNWDRRQFASDTSTDRVAKHRRSNGDATAMERQRNVSVTPPENREQSTEENTCSNVEPATLALVAEKPSADAEDAPQIDPFVAWWELYPRKVGKAPSAKAYAKALTGRDRATPEILTARLRIQIRAWRTEGRPLDKTPHASTWLNERRWDDEALTKPAGNSQPGTDHLGPQEQYR